MVYDCFQFFNELDILKLRMQVMSPVVDYFVISEATTTFSSIPKPLYYEGNKEMFKEFEDKIIHVVVDDTPPGDTHVRDTFQKSAVGRGLKNCTDEDIIIFSDLDEIPNPIKVQEILQNCDETKIYHFAQRLFYCYLNMEEVSGKLLSYAGDFDGVEKKQWIGSKMCSYKLLREQNLQLGDLRFPERKECGIRVEDGGWHFGYMGGHGETHIRKRVQQKVVSAAHQEYKKGTSEYVTQIQLLCSDKNRTAYVAVITHYGNADGVADRSSVCSQKVRMSVDLSAKYAVCDARRYQRVSLRYVDREGGKLDPSRLVRYYHVARYGVFYRRY